MTTTKFLCDANKVRTDDYRISAWVFGAYRVEVKSVDVEDPWYINVWLSGRRVMSTSVWAWRDVEPLVESVTENFPFALALSPL